MQHDVQLFSTAMKLPQVLYSSSTYSVGLAYEMLVLNVLQKYKFQLKHTGGAGDGGQDFNGYWLLPDKNIPVVGQCKCFRKTIGPVDVREFEDVLFRKFVTVNPNHSTPHQSISSYIGLMASKSWFTPAALRTFHSSKLAMILWQILPENTSTNFGSVSISQENQETIYSKNSLYQARTNEDVGLQSEHGIDGYVNEIALNSVAQRALGDVQVVWRQEPGKTRGLLRISNKRQLHVLIKGKLLYM